MKGLRPAQVCVIDDEPEEYQHMLRALNEAGLGCVHVAGDKVEDLPKEPLRGLRLVFLDMYLGTAGSDKRVITAHTANVFAHVVAKESAPIAVVVWTKHADYVEAFRESLFEAHADYRGRLFIVRLEKPADSSKLDSKKLLEDIRRELDKLTPLPLLWGWDSLVQAATCAVTDELCRLAAKRAALDGKEDESAENRKVLEALSTILRILIVAEGGKAAARESAAATLLAVLAPLHLDRLENAPPTPELDGASELLGTGSKAESSAEEASAINTMLLVGASQREGAGFPPGTIYCVQDAEAFAKATSTAVELMAKSICQDSLFVAGKEEALKNWLATSKPILVEISPACDFSQRKRPVARLVGGFLVPREGTPLAKKAGLEGDSHLRSLPAIRLLELDATKDWLPHFSSQLLFAWPETLGDGWEAFLKPVGRLREAVLSDLRDWLAAQSGRLGYLFVAEGKAK